MSFIKARVHVLGRTLFLNIFEQGKLTGSQIAGKLEFRSSGYPEIRHIRDGVVYLKGTSDKTEAYAQFASHLETATYGQILADALKELNEQYG